MTKLTMVDLKILFLGINKDGSFDENDIEKSDLKKLGVGRILDQLASLKERGLIEMNSNGSFSITNSGKNILWDDQIPLWLKILRILEIKSQNTATIASFLLASLDKVNEEIEDLRKRHLVLMSPLRNETGLEKFYEILPEGIETIEKSQKGEFKDKPQIKNSQVEILPILDETIKQIQGMQEISSDKKQNIVSNLLKIKEKLEI
ncbi:MAG: hypothetical protein H2B05_05500 [Nitrosopumilaceae archaeon]|uniref:Uncharacterized protein n=2 Tax=Candidatus Nitrosomaritimum aestuariumsis TaxID=3342354 RepID=A0AC60VX97_9ARCH|nr:hypothetical protein [Nitrosopumilaceae archaeon]MBA4454381.1 hypothetical protein [Nitrosopumilaceae archaeon]MBA4460305.1 hypothetical protein [Nitrosopumilaceae archaeon]